jgi:hypothetical protein
MRETVIEFRGEGDFEILQGLRFKETGIKQEVKRQSYEYGR